MSNSALTYKLARVEEAKVEKVRYHNDVPFLICRCDDPEIHSINTPIELLTTVRMTSPTSDVNSSNSAGFSFVPSEGERILIIFTSTNQFSDAYFFGVIADPYAVNQIKNRRPTTAGAYSHITKNGTGFNLQSNAEIFSAKSRVSISDEAVKLKIGNTDFIQIHQKTGLSYFSNSTKSSFFINRKAFLAVEGNIELFSKSGNFSATAASCEMNFRGGTYNLKTSTIYETSQKHFTSTGVFVQKISAGSAFGVDVSWDVQVISGNAMLATASGDIIFQGVTPGMCNIQLLVGPLSLPLSQMLLTQDSVLVETMSEIKLNSMYGKITAEALTDISFESTTGKVNIKGLGDVSVDSSTGNVKITGAQKVTIELASGQKIELSSSGILIDGGGSSVKLGSDSAAGGVLTVDKNPIVDNITGAPHQGSTIVLSA